MNQIKELTYDPRYSLLNEKEFELYNMLCEAAQKNYIIFSQVSTSQFLYIGDKDHARNDKLKEIGLTSFDFLLCKKENKGKNGIDVRPLIAIELNGKIHEEEARKYNDKKKLNAVESAGISVLIVETNKMPSKEELKELIDKYVVKSEENFIAKKNAKKNELFEKQKNSLGRSKAK